MKLRPLTSMSGLTPDQLDQISIWLETHSYTQVTDLIQKEFNQRIPRSAISRFFHRDQSKLLSESREDLSEMAKEFHICAATGQTDFSLAATELLKQKRFELALEFKELDQLKLVSNLLIQDRNAATRERLAAVEERKALLKEKQYEERKTNPSSKPANEPAPQTPAPESPAATQQETGQPQPSDTPPPKRERTEEEIRAFQDKAWTILGIPQDKWEARREWVKQMKAERALEEKQWEEIEAQAAQNQNAA